MKLLGKKKELDELWEIMKHTKDNPVYLMNDWDKIKEWLKKYCEWKETN
jgi:5,10-methylenetetrahydrofolate reductase